jgi:hypothetical protein
MSQIADNWRFWRLTFVQLFPRGPRTPDASRTPRPRGAPGVIWALEAKVGVDGFIVLTDSETWFWEDPSRAGAGEVPSVDGVALA